MLSSANLDWFRFRQYGADGVSADIGFAPPASMFQVKRATGVYNPGISLRVDDQSRRVGQDHHGICIAQERLRTFERGTRGVTERGVFAALTI
jgi:hypothetical protein